MWLDLLCTPQASRYIHSFIHSFITLITYISRISFHQECNNYLILLMLRYVSGQDKNMIHQATYRKADWAESRIYASSRKQLRDFLQEVNVEITCRVVVEMAHNLLALAGALCCISHSLSTLHTPLVILKMQKVVLCFIPSFILCYVLWFLDLNYEYDSCIYLL